MQLDALRELANVASGTAATAMSQLLGQEVEINVPQALALPLVDAVDACGDPEETVTGIVIPLEGDVAGLVLMLIPTDDAAALCQLLGVEFGTEWGDSALCEIGNIVGTSYLNGLSAMTGMYLGPCPPHLCIDLLGAIVASLLAQTAGEAETVLVLDSELGLHDDACAMSFLLLPSAGGVSDLLAPLGLAS
jgi:chemotaxis protein CheC